MYSASRQLLGRCKSYVIKQIRGELARELCQSRATSTYVDSVELDLHQLDHEICRQARTHLRARALAKASGETPAFHAS